MEEKRGQVDLTVLPDNIQYRPQPRYPAPAAQPLAPAAGAPYDEI